MLPPLFAQKASVLSAIILRLSPGQDLKLVLDDYVQKNRITSACILTGVGNFTQVGVQYADQSKTTLLTGHFDLVSLAGTLSMQGSHLHLSFSDASGHTLGGQLKEGSVIHTTAEIILGVFPELTFSREPDSHTGYKELVVKRKPPRFQ